MQQMRVSHWLTEMAHALAVSKSGFFAHQRKGERPRVRQDNELSQAIEPIFVASRKTYGSPRIMHALRRSGWRCGKNRIARLMRPAREAKTSPRPHFRGKITCCYTLPLPLPLSLLRARRNISVTPKFLLTRIWHAPNDFACRPTSTEIMVRFPI
jgi:transposase InsO family protein